ncbi:hypothetical protein Htur_4945 (plasmid) [Haloterrigena turkmenica DSM 5511]|uniref:Uncharacterized protein n=1 Tax=Haloterrigena turkmenica (strain ATCC 51198 / DSM 5511 / JCM 9101 / NCIMB 13204 / VKM B-1734 / 4k) TaxID=543526 RepID=D2S2T4_HALTV|nr:hypothetical protein [Haloterrigena turkmenica]ADB63681.1 hypothetical protein Htur_4945 [Haloterrigena turkmenica DSM 5511]
MSDPVGSWSDEQMQAELEAVLADLQTLDEHLVEPLTLADSIIELEATRAMYEHAVMEA